MDWYVLAVGVVSLTIGLILVMFYGHGWGWVPLAIGVAGIIAPFFMRAAD